MNHHEMDQRPGEGGGTEPAPRRAGGWIAATMVAVIVAFYVLREHWGHALGALPYLLLLACPLLHLFGHGRHRH